MSQRICGLHDYAGHEAIVGGGYVVESLEVRHNPQDWSSHLFTVAANKGITVIGRLNNGYGSTGTIPTENHYRDFAVRCGNFVERSQGCNIWIIGNEMNLPVERPGGVPITPAMYARVFRMCRDEIRRRPGRANDQVVIGSVGPWNAETRYEGNPEGDWIKYYTDCLNAIGSSLDGISIHAYSRTSNPSEVAVDTFNTFSFGRRRWTFTVYKDFMEAIPQALRHLPVYLTEANYNGPWTDQRLGWMPAAVDEINRWNRVPNNQQIRCVVFFRFEHFPVDGMDYGFRRKANVMADFRDAMARGHTWVPTASPSRPTGVIQSPPMVIDGRAMTSAEFVQHIENLEFLDPKPNRIFLHHTWKPTVADWRGRHTIMAMKRHYERQVWTDASGVTRRGWTAGPHLFIAPDGLIWLFSDIRRDGVGVQGHNHRSIHVEMVGNYDQERPGGILLRSTIASLGVLTHKLNLQPANLRFHRDHSTKTCPGSQVEKPWVVGLVNEWLRQYEVERILRGSEIPVNPEAALFIAAKKVFGDVGVKSPEVTFPYKGRSTVGQVFYSASLNQKLYAWAHLDDPRPWEQKIQWFVWDN